MKKIALIVMIVATLALAGCKSERTVTVSHEDANSLPSFEATQVELFLNSRPTLSFLTDVVSDAQIEKLLQAGANSSNLQITSPYHITVVTKEKKMAEIVSDSTKGCVVILISTPINDENIFNGGLVTQNIYLAAKAMGLGSNIYTDVPDKVNTTELKDDLKIPEGNEVVGAICVGYENESSNSLEYAPFENNVTYID